MNEASKTMHYFSGLLNPIFEGRTILDIGAGLDPIKPWAYVFDMEQGNAQDISKYGLNKFGCVFSSHCLEHMLDPLTALQTWWELVESQGYLIFIVPEEDLYEQGNFPSIFNGDHKATFTLGKESSWSNKSYGIYDLIGNLTGGLIKYCKIQDNGYERDKQNFRFKLKELYHFLRSNSMKIFRVLNPIMVGLRLWPIDQTSLGDLRLAQIMVILQKVDKSIVHENKIS